VRFLITILLLAASIDLAATTISGRVTDLNGEPLPFATLYVQNTTKGTTTNLDGYYSIDLPAGIYQLIFQYVGYKRTSESIVLGKNTVQLNVILEAESLLLKEVVVSASDVDPAYRVIREAIKKRKYHKEQVQAYKCQVYIKGLQTIDEKPDKIFGFAIPLDTGIVYLSESISELSFELPDNIKEVMISSKVSGNNNSFSYNQGSQMLFSFYDNLLKAEGLSERGYVSPIANNALLFYEYSLEGIIQENGLIINKIKVLSRRKNDPTFIGYIYIIEDSWRIHSVDLTLTKDHQLEFIDDLNIRQVYAPVQENIWMMISQKFSFKVDIFGFKGKGNFIGIHSDYEIEVNKNLLEEKIDTLDLPQQNDGQVARPSFEKLFPKKYFNNEVLVVEDNSNKRDSIYWTEIRPIPLTKIEVLDYKRKDSLQVIFNSKPYKDSIDKVVNKINPANILYSGYVYQKSFEERYFRFEPIIENLQYNTVEGFVIFLKSTYSKSKNSVVKYQIIPEVRYGFSNKKAYGQLFGRLYYNPKKFSRVLMHFGSYPYQFNSLMPISALINTLETLLNRSNYLKLYEKNFFRVMHQSEITNGLLITSNLEYANRQELFNTTDYSLLRKNDTIFLPNIPLNQELSDATFGSNNALSLDLALSIRFKQKYITRPDQKYIMGTKYPRFRISYSKGFSTLGSDVDFDKISIDVRDHIDYQLLGSGNYSMGVGTFLNDKKLTLIDFKHFNGSRTALAQFSQDNFQLLDYYNFSTSKNWFAAHYNHHFNGFLINKFPFLRKTKVQAVGSINYLLTETSRDYLEYGFALEHIFKVFRIDYYMGFLKGSHYASGIKLGMGF
jgi:hypothetical protein